MNNVNPTTGIRFGVIAGNSLDADVLEELMRGPGANDLTYQAAYDDAKREAQKKFEGLLEEAAIEAAESGAIYEGGFDLSTYQEKWLERNGHETDGEQFVEDELEQFSDIFECAEPSIEGEYEGVKYRVGWLGGAPLVWICEGPVGTARSLCSPCIPNAADLDSGFTGAEFANGRFDNECYVCPSSWLAEVEAREAA